MARAALFAAVAATAAAAAAPASTGNPAWIWQLPLNASVNLQATALTAQGLLNRASAQVWLDVPLFWFSPNSTRWFPSEYLGPVKGYTFTNVTGSLCDLLAATGLIAPGGLVSGVALYNETALDATRWLAVTAAALDGLLPLSVNDRSDGNFTCLASLPVKVDYSDPAALGWSDPVAAYQWAQGALLPRCNQSSLFSAGQSWVDATGATYNGHDPAILIGLDGAVAAQPPMLVFNLSPDTTNYPEQAAQFQALVAAVRNNGTTLVPSLYGWAEPEPMMTWSTSKGGGSVLCDAAPNLSFWNRVASSFPALPYHSNSAIQLQKDRVYLTFQSNEGDTPKIAAALQGGAWTDPRRGSVPIAWGINPLLATFAPGLLEFYANTATANDSWFAATAGAGYAYPHVMPPDVFQAYTKRAGDLLGAVTPGWPQYANWIDIWDSNFPSNITSYAANTGMAVGAFSMQPESMESTNSWLPQPDGAQPLPLIITNKTLWYAMQWKCTPPNASDPASWYTEAIEATVRNIPTRPVFLLVYGITPADACGLSMLDYAPVVQQRLGGGSADGVVPPVQLVGAQDMARLAREAGARGWVPAATPADPPASAEAFTALGKPRA